MLKPALEKALNEQLNEEMYSSFIYLSMSAAFEKMGLGGFAKWQYAQYAEERDHGEKIYQYILERGGDVTLKQINQPPSNWDSALQIFDETLKHEEHITERINNLMDLAITEKDHATANFLQWFVAEQVEEEATVSAVIDKLNLVSDSKHGLYMLDKEMSERGLTASAE